MSGLTVGDLFLSSARRNPQRVAVREVTDGSALELTYAELHQRVLAGAAEIRMERGLDLRDRVLLMASNGVDFLVAVLASAVAGTAIVPVSTQLTQPELEYILSNCGPKLALADPDHLAAVTEAVQAASPQDAPPVLVHHTLGRGEAPVSVTWSRAAADDLVYLGYTSGTTGRPKGVCVSNGNRVKSVYLQSAEFRMGRGDEHLVVSPLYHTAPLTFAILHLGLGGTVTVRRDFDAAAVAADLLAGRFTNCFLAPAALQRVLAKLPEGASVPAAVRSVVIGGAPCPANVKSEALRHLIGRLWEFYGATEVGVVTTLRPEEQELRPRSVGKLIPGAEVEIRDPDTGEPVAEEAIGQVWVHTLSRAEGYYGLDPLPDKWSYLGDVGFLDRDGYLHLVDRSVDIVISGGMNVYSREVETVLEAHPDIAEVAVFGVPDERWGEAVVAAVRSSAETVDVEKVQEFAAQSLAAFKRPRRILVLDDLPRSATGKTDKKALRARFGKLIAGHSAGQEPSHPSSGEIR